MNELIQPVLVVIVGYLLKKGVDGLNFLFGKLGLELRVNLDEKAFNSLVLAIVAFLLAQLGFEQAARLLG